MKREIYEEAYRLLDFPHRIVDALNRTMIVPMHKGSSEEALCGEHGLVTWLVDNGFNVEMKRGDFEYITKGDFNTRAMRRTNVHKAYLRDRVILTITWEEVE